MLSPALSIVLAHTVGAVLLGWIYFRRYRVTRPPIGVLNLRDIGLLFGAIIVVPYLYLTLPVWLVTALLSMSIVTILYLTGEAVLRSPWRTWLASLTLVAADIWIAVGFGPFSAPFLIVNNLTLVLVVVGVTNLWVQGGLKARDAAILGGGLAIYDLVTTTWLSLMTDMLGRLSGLPFAPMVAWAGTGDGYELAVGLGDLLLATVFPLVMRKAFGRNAGLVAMLLGLSAVTALLVLLDLRLVTGALPAMAVLGPLMLLQYAYWISRRGAERTTWQYQQVEPLHHPIASAG